MKTNIVTIVITASILVLSSGCVAPVILLGAGAAGGAGTYAYVNGEVTAVVSASMDHAWGATLAAMKELEFPILSQAKDSLQGQLTAHNASGKKVTIKVKKVSDQATEIHIRVGTFGDEALSHVILGKIQKQI